MKPLSMHARLARPLLTHNAIGYIYPNLRGILVEYRSLCNKPYVAQLQFGYSRPHGMALLPLQEFEV